MLLHAEQPIQRVKNEQPLADPLTIVELFPSESAAEYRIHRLSNIGKTAMQPGEGTAAQQLQHKAGEVPLEFGDSPLIIQDGLWLPPSNRQLFRFRFATAEYGKIGVQNMFDNELNSVDIAPLTPMTCEMGVLHRQFEGKQETAVIASRGIAHTVDDLYLSTRRSYAMIAPESPGLKDAVLGLHEDLTGYHQVPEHLAEGVLSFLTEALDATPELQNLSREA